MMKYWDMKYWQLAVLIGVLIWLGRPSDASALLGCAMDQVTGLEFVGWRNVCNDGTVHFSGHWILDDGGRLEGQAVLTLPGADAYTISKQGLLITPQFSGNFYRTEQKSSSTLIVSEILSGKETLAGGGTLDGMTRTTVNPDGSQSVTKQGTLKTPGFDGILYRTEQKAATGQVMRSEILSGKELLSAGGMMNGQTRTTVNPDGSQSVTKQGTLKTPGFDGILYRTEQKAATGQVMSSEIQSGTWILAPDEKLTGTWQMTQNPDGTMTISDNRVRVTP